MHKYIIFIILLVQGSLVFAQYNPGSIGVVTRFAGAYNISAPEGSDMKNFGYSLTMLEFYPQVRKGLLGYSAYIQVRFATPFLADERIGTFINEFRWGFLFGGSSRLINTVSTYTGKGWGLFLNGGMTIDLTTAQRYKDMTARFINSPVNLGAELSLRAVYNFNRYAAVTFGIDIGYIISFSYIDTTDISSAGGGIIPNIPDINDVIFQQALVYGFTVGFLF